MRPALRRDPLRPADAGAADADPQPVRRLCGLRDRGLDLALRRHVAENERGTVTQLAHERRPLLCVHVRDGHVGAALVERARRSLSEARRSTHHDRPAVLDPHGAEAYSG
jgi:hypothetical protein